jgi:SSS family solute:Na+ symporter
MERLPANMAIFILISICAAIMSSADSYLLATGVIFSNDIVKEFLNKKANDKEMIFWTQFFVIIAGAVGFAFALNIEDIIYLWIIGIGIGATLILPAYLAAWFSRRINTKGALSGIAAGTVYSSLWVLEILDFSIEKIFYGIMINAAVMIAVSALTERPEPSCIGSTFYWSGKFSDVKRIPF